jgi:hypothetical protein
MQKFCVIRNGLFSYRLEVDGQNVGFTGAHNAKYFKEHYASLGYTVIEHDDNA